MIREILGAKKSHLGDLGGSSKLRCVYIYIYIPGTQMSLVLIGKDLVLETKQRTNGFQVYRYIYLHIYTSIFQRVLIQHPLDMKTIQHPLLCQPMACWFWGFWEIISSLYITEAIETSKIDGVEHSAAWTRFKVMTKALQLHRSQ